MTEKTVIEGIDQIHELRTKLENLGCAVVIWVKEDFPGRTVEEQEDNFGNFADTICDICIERGNEAIANICDYPEGEEDEDDEDE